MLSTGKSAGYRFNSTNEQKHHCNGIEKVEDTNLEAYENLDESVDVIVPGEGDEPVESGIIKELAKTLLVGGLVRLSAGVAKKML
jgi:hypothetical protein